MDIEGDVDVLNEHGVISSNFLMRRHKCGVGFARNILKMIVDQYENVKFRSGDQIYIEGREPQQWQLKPKRIRIRPKKPSRWKDVTKP